MVASKTFDDENCTIETLLYSPLGKYLGMLSSVSTSPSRSDPAFPSPSDLPSLYPPLTAIGFTNGQVKILNGDTLEDVCFQEKQSSDNATKTKTASFDVSASPIMRMRFSPDECYMATSDADHRVSLFEFEPQGYVQNQWVYVGSFKAHSDTICGLEYFVEEDRLVLASIGHDRHMVKYDLKESTVVDGVRILVGCTDQ